MQQKWHRKLLTVACAAVVLCTTAACQTRPDPLAELEALQVQTDKTDTQTPESNWDTAKNPQSTAKKLAPCSRVLLLSVRGTQEPQGVSNNLNAQVASELTKLLAKTTDQAENSVFRHLDIEYPASSDFGSSSPEGIRKLIDLINAQTHKCPKQQLLLSGYSQGALVIGEALTAPEKRFLGSGVGMLSRPATRQIRGITFFGDPRFLSSDSFNTGGYAKGVDGSIPRLPGALDSYKQKILSFCVQTDVVCQAGTTVNETGHVAYYKNGMPKAAAKFLASKIKAD